MDVRKKCVALLLFYHTGAALEIFVPSTHQATAGRTALIPCRYTVEKPPVKPNFFAAFWSFQGKEILSFNDEVRRVDSRYSLNIEKALDGTVDLSISNIAMSDAGVYTCSVLYSPTWKQKEITVDIKAPPQVTITGNTVVMNKESVLRCSITGFYPVDIDIRWFRGTETLSNVTKDGKRRNSDGTYSVNSSVTITPTEEDRERNFSCRVHHESLQEPLQEDFQLIYRDKNVRSENQISTITIPVTVAVSILVIIPSILGIGYCIWKKVKSKTRSPHTQISENTLQPTSAQNVNSASPMNKSAGALAMTGTLPDLEIGEIKVPQLILNKNVTLECPLYNYIPGAHTVIWLEKKMNTDEPMAVNDPRRLITIDRDRESDDEGTHISSMSLTPVTEEDHGTIYICRVESNSRQPTERSTEELQVTGNKTGLCDQTETLIKETQKERTQRLKDSGGCSVTELIHKEEKQKTQVQIHKTSAEQETNQSGEYDNIKPTEELKNENSRGLCPSNKLSEERMEEHSLQTNKPINEKKNHCLEESSTRNDEEELKEKENDETSQVINKLYHEQDFDQSVESLTREYEELNKEKNKNEKTSQLFNELFNEQEIDPFVEGSTMKDEEELNKESEEASQLIKEPFNEQEIDKTGESSTRQGKEELTKEKKEEKEAQRVNDGGLRTANESPEEDNEETSLLKNNMNLETGLKELS